MGLRPGRCYRNSVKRMKHKPGAAGHSRRRKGQRAYSRISKVRPSKNFIGATPQLKIRQFNMGNPLLKYTTVADLITKEAMDIRDNALESVRSTVNRKLVKDLGKDAYFMKLRVFPSQILRENKQAQGAGADRVSQGMSLAFGIPIGRAARVKAGQVLMSILCFDNQKEQVRAALSRAKSKFACDIQINFHHDIKSLGTLPSKAIEEKVVVAAVEKKEGEAALAAAATTDAKAAEAGKTGAAAGKTPAAAPTAAGKDAGKAPAAGAKPAGKK